MSTSSKSRLIAALNSANSNPEPPVDDTSATFSAPVANSSDGGVTVSVSGKQRHGYTTDPVAITYTRDDLSTVYGNPLKVSLDNPEAPTKEAIVNRLITRHGSYLSASDLQAPQRASADQPWTLDAADDSYGYYGSATLDISQIIAWADTGDGRVPDVIVHTDKDHGAPVTHNTRFVYDADNDSYVFDARSLPFPSSAVHWLTSGVFISKIIIDAQAIALMYLETGNGPLTQNEVNHYQGPSNPTIHILGYEFKINPPLADGTIPFKLSNSAQKDEFIASLAQNVYPRQVDVVWPSNPYIREDLSNLIFATDFTSSKADLLAQLGDANNKTALTTQVWSAVCEALHKARGGADSDIPSDIDQYPPPLATQEWGTSQDMGSWSTLYTNCLCITSMSATYYIHFNN